MAERSRRLGCLARTHADDRDDPQPRQDDQQARPRRRQLALELLAVTPADAAGLDLHQGLIGPDLRFG